ncbi:hypothetical protein Cgig2_001037 [Carnegiea gigantea]|uniref:Uncharacterized protein n=1 Tax=Carnegiea gigantea TaxID=171969 RepID=A0A9Q1JKV9_9CARY|nr:hypothetical protein Cgig2_001037 [Carnegiea gigantea]
MQPNNGLNELVNSDNPHDDNVSDDDMESKPCGAAEYEDNNGGEEGDREENEVSDSREDSSKDGDFDESDMKDEIPRVIDTGGHGDNGNPTENIWTKIYLSGKMWARNSNRTFSMVDGDIFVDKDHWSKVLEIIQFKKGLIKAMESIFLESRRRIYVTHFYRNSYVDYPGDVFLQFF